MGLTKGWRDRQGAMDLTNDDPPSCFHKGTGKGCLGDSIADTSDAGAASSGREDPDAWKAEVSKGTSATEMEVDAMLDDGEYFRPLTDCWATNEHADQVGA